MICCFPVSHVLGALSNDPSILDSINWLGVISTRLQKNPNLGSGTLTRGNTTDINYVQKKHSWWTKKILIWGQALLTCVGTFLKRMRHWIIVNHPLSRSWSHGTTCGPRHSCWAKVCFFREALSPFNTHVVPLPIRGNATDLAIHCSRCYSVLCWKTEAIDHRVWFWFTSTIEPEGCCYQ